MQALEYIHSKNVYYGDMKEANILIFRDFSVKLGDFGISIKMEDSPLQERDSEEYIIKGITPGYITDLV